MSLKMKASVAAAGRPGSGRVPTDVDRMEVPLASETEIGSCWLVTLERHAVVEGKKWPVVPVSAMAGVETTGRAGGSTGVGATGSASLGGLG